MCKDCKKKECECGPMKAIAHETKKASHPTNRRKGMTGHK